MKSNKGFTLIELLIVIGIIAVIVAIAVPGLIRARQSGNEASAIGSLRAINSAQATYAASCGKGFFSPSLMNLGMPGPDRQPFLTSDLTGAVSVEKSGYNITMGSTSGKNRFMLTSCNGAESMNGYWATATPAAAGDGTRAFGTNTAGTIYWVVQQRALAMTDISAPINANPLE